MLELISFKRYWLFSIGSWLKKGFENPKENKIKKETRKKLFMNLQYNYDWICFTDRAYFWYKAGANRIAEYINVEESVFLKNGIARV